MKSLLIIIALFGFQISNVFGERYSGWFSGAHVPGIFCTECPALLPVVPEEAPYDDQAEVVTLMLEESLIPVIPQEAGFSDSETTLPVASPNLVPQIPSEAGFSDLDDTPPSW